MATTTRRDKDRQRGLPSLNEARAERRRAIVAGKVRIRAMPPQFWLWTALALAAVLVVYWKIAQGKLESQKNAVMAKQRAIAQSLGPQILPFRDKIEGWVTGLAGSYKGDYFDPKARYGEISRAPGVYLRLRSENAQTPEAIRKAAVRSLHDGFTSCFFRGTNLADQSKGPPCESSADCAEGLLCNEYDKCAPPPEPFNMRLAYRSLRVLSSAWTDELHEATNDLAVTAYDRDLDRVTREDVPIAAKILARAKYFVAVVDEDPKGGLPEVSDGGVESDEERVQRVAHVSRIGIWRLSDGKLVLCMRRMAQGRVVPVGDHVITRERTIKAQARQANSCALALEARNVLSPIELPAQVDGGAPADAGGPADAGAPR